MNEAMEILDQQNEDGQFSRASYAVNNEEQVFQFEEPDKDLETSERQTENDENKRKIIND